MARLSTYHAKRDFRRTPEPRGRIARGVRKSLRFVVQRHDATRLHYDFRLELDGVFKSWAVTKTPSLDPAVKRLAVEVEDHPLDYGTFEGTIPKGQYGGGTVQLWDRGTWTPQTDTPERDLANGHLKILLRGERMKGKWALVRLRDRDVRPGRTVRHNWLLIKEIDEEADRAHPDALEKDITSVKTGRTLDEIARKSHAVWNSNREDGKPARAVRTAPKSVRSKKKMLRRPRTGMRAR